jgi:hypothetical protein
MPITGITVTDRRHAQPRTWSVEAASVEELRQILKQAGATVVVIETSSYAIGLGGAHAGNASSDPIAVDAFSEKQFAQLVAAEGPEVASPEGVTFGCRCEVVITA